MKYVKKFEEVGMNDIALVGGKNASLGQMITHLASQGITVPRGFAITAPAYWYVINSNNLLPDLEKLFAGFTKTGSLEQLHSIALQARSLIENAYLPDDLAQEIVSAYAALSKTYKVEACDVAIRSSATAEDSPTASFAGQQDSYLNVVGEDQVLKFCKKSMASLFTDRAIIYRMDKGFDHFKMAISVGVQKMVRSDKACSGVAFSLDTESGFKDVVVIDASYGLGETIVQGQVIPDEFYVYKPMLAQGYKPIVRKHLGTKKIKKIYANNEENTIQQVEVPEKDQRHFCLRDDEILQLALWVMKIEEHYTKLASQWMPMDVEWAKDGIDGKLYIIQARPETVHAHDQHPGVLTRYIIKNAKESELVKSLLVQGESIGQKIASGKACVVESAQHMNKVKAGDIIVTHMTDPDWVPVLKKAAGIVTSSGGRTCHAAIVSRELGIPAIVGAEGALTAISQGQEITIDCSHGKTGFVFDGKIPFEVEHIEIAKIPKPSVEVMVNLAFPDRAYDLSFLPVSGVGLARLEFTITNKIKIHPMAIVHPEKIEDAETKKAIAEITSAYANPQTFFVDRLSQAVGTIAAAFYPRPVFIRLPDFNSNEYRNLIGGKYFEIVEENPMLGFRGASRYYHERYREAFGLICDAMKRVREVMGLTNIKIMIPFVRTVAEAKKVIAEMKRNGLERGQDGLELCMMCEIPADVLLIDEFSPLFDGFSIGSNDLTQFTLSVDRNSELLAPLFDERDEAVKKMMVLAIEGAKRNHKYIGICGQAPSDYPELADFLICQGINSLSLNEDVVISFLMTNPHCVLNEK